MCRGGVFWGIRLEGWEFMDWRDGMDAMEEMDDTCVKPLLDILIRVFFVSFVASW